MTTQLVTVRLDVSLVQSIDEAAARVKKSRSGWIQSVLETAAREAATQSPATPPESGIEKGPPLAGHTSREAYDAVPPTIKKNF